MAGGVRKGDVQATQGWDWGNEDDLEAACPGKGDW